MASNTSALAGRETPRLSTIGTRFQITGFCCPQIAFSEFLANSDVSLTFHQTKPIFLETPNEKPTFSLLKERNFPAGKITPQSPKLIRWQFPDFGSHFRWSAQPVDNGSSGNLVKILRWTTFNSFSIIEKWVFHRQFCIFPLFSRFFDFVHVFSRLFTTASHKTN